MGQIIQLPLPATDHVPAWVFAALDSYTTPDGRHLTGFGVLLHNGSNPALAQYREHKEERSALRNLQRVARMWQLVGFRTWLSPLERDVHFIETNVRKQARGMVDTKGCPIYDADGYQVFDTLAIHKEVQRQAQRQLHVSLSESEIRTILNHAETIFNVADYLGVTVSYSVPNTAKVIRAA